MVSFEQGKALVIMSDYLNWMCTQEIDALLQDYYTISYIAQIMNMYGYDILSHIDTMINDLEADHDVSQLKLVHFNLSVCLPVLDELSEVIVKPEENKDFLEQKLYEAEKDQNYEECARIKIKLDALQKRSKDE